MTTLSVTKQITLPGVSITLDELRSVLEDAALGFVHPQVSINVHRGGNDPREHDYATLTITERIPVLEQCDHVDPEKGRCIKPEDHVESGSSGVAAHGYNPRGSVNG